MPRERQKIHSSDDLGCLIAQSPLSDSVFHEGLKREQVVWRPNRRSLRRLPADFELPFDIWTDESDGLRRIVPRQPLHHFLIRAALGGLAIRHRTAEMTGEERQSYRLQILVFQWSFSDRDLMVRHWKRMEDLSLRRRERSGESDRDVLPEIWVPEGDSEVRLTPETLVNRGESLANATGMPRGNVQAELDAGILATALERDGFTTMPLGQASSLLRYALFGWTQNNEAIEPATRQLIESRFIEAVQKHLHHSDDDFRRWLWSDFSNLVQQLHQRKTDGIVDREMVKRVIDGLLWQSYSTVSTLVRLQMQAVRLALTPTMTGNERRLYGHWYERQPWLGDLAPVMLHHRLTLLLPTLASLEGDDADSDRTWRGLLLAMVWSQEMTRNRREADRTQKAGGASQLLDNEGLVKGTERRMLTAYQASLQSELYNLEREDTVLKLDQLEPLSTDGDRGDAGDWFLE